MIRGELQAELSDILGSDQEAKWILEDVLGKGPNPRPPNAAQVEVVRAMAERCRSGEPLQYVLGHWSFRDLDLAVDERALIPRPETEQVVEVGLEELARAAGSKNDPIVVDLGVGSGAITLAVATEALDRFPLLQVWATDQSTEALALAAVNRDRIGVTAPLAAERVTLRQGSWFEALPETLKGRVDLVISNPPYVSEAEWPGLDARGSPGAQTCTGGRSGIWWIARAWRH